MAALCILPRFMLQKMEWQLFHVTGEALHHVYELHIKTLSDALHEFYAILNCM